MEQDTVDTLDKRERGLLLYLETCVVDQAGRVEAIRMNADDFGAAERLEAKGIAAVRRLKFRYVEDVNAKIGKRYTHLVVLSSLGWYVAHSLRVRRATEMLDKYGPAAEDIAAGKPIPESITGEAPDESGDAGSASG